MARKPAPEGSDRRQQILEAALDLFAEQGLNGATSKDIAERANVTHGLIYFYFKTKEELFKAAFEYALERALTRLDVAAIAQSDDPPEEALTHLLARFLEALNTPRMLSMSRVMMHTMAHNDWRTGPLYECKLRAQSMIGYVVDEVRIYLDRQVALGHLRPTNTEIVAKFLVGGVMSSIRWTPSDGRGDYPPQDTARVVANACMRGLLRLPNDPPGGEVPCADTLGAPSGAPAHVEASIAGAVALIDD